MGRAFELRIEVLPSCFGEDFGGLVGNMNQYER